MFLLGNIVLEGHYSRIIKDWLGKPLCSPPAGRYIPLVHK